MAELTNYQKKIVERYYDRKDEIMLTRLQELVTDLYLAETDKKRESLWKRVEQAMASLKVPPTISQHIMTKKSAEVLARNVQDWLKQARSK